MINKNSNGSLFLLRGLPGSGKSTAASILCEQGTYPVFSIDDYFTDPVTGVYTFEFDKNHEAYRVCEQKTRTALQSGIEKIFVANTFTHDWEIAPYIKLAEEFHYAVFVFTIENYHNGVNKHGVTDNQIKKMAEKYTLKLY